MDLLNMVLGAANNGGLDSLAKKFGLSSDQTKSAMASIVPALAKGLQSNVGGGGLDSLIGALTKGNHSQYIDNPAQMLGQSGVSEGNNILGHILGGKDQSRALASEAASSTGIDSSILKQMLPMIATMVMGNMNKQTASSSGTSGIGSMLSGFLDADGDGSVADDLLGMAKKFF